MKLSLFSVVSCVSIVLLIGNEINAQAMAYRNSEHPDHPGFCYYRDEYGNGENKFFLKPGQKRKHPKLCFKVNCAEDFTISTTGCGLAANMGHCHFIQGDTSKPYPRCCGEVVC